jgi:DNA-binding FadR family transcriptional regulator
VNIPYENTGYPANSVHGRIVHRIGADIVASRVQPGERLPREAELMAEFGASRSAVRDAVKVLASKGLVKTRQRGGTQVCEPQRWNAFDVDILAWRFAAGIDLRFVQDLVELRLATEPFAVRLAAVRAEGEDLARIAAALERMRASSGDWAAYAKADGVFHMAVFAASHNPFFLRLGMVVHDVLSATFNAEQAFSNRGLAEMKRVVAKDIAVHTRLFEAIAQKDPARAEEQILTIITFARANLSQAVTGS